MNVTETNIPNQQRFGPPTVSGDMLDFLALNFSSISVNNNVDLTTSRLTMTVTAHPGFQIDAIEVQEFGSVFLFGTTAQAQVSAQGFAVDGPNLYPGGFNQSFVGTQSGTWQGGFTINVPSLTQVDFRVDNFLLTFAGLGEAAAIDKLGFQIFVHTSVIPEPTQGMILLLFALGLVLLGSCRSRRPLTAGLK